MRKIKSLGQAVALLSILVCSCSSPQLVLKSPHPEVLRVRMDITQEVPDLVRNELETQFTNYISWHNASPSRFKLETVEPHEPVDLQFTVLVSRLVTSSQQTAGVVLSMIGLSLPIIMASAGAELVVFFWYFPRVNSVVELSLDPEISGGPYSKIHRVVSSPGFLKSEPRQIARHGQYYFSALKNIFLRLDKK